MCSLTTLPLLTLGRQFIEDLEHDWEHAPDAPRGCESP